MASIMYHTGGWHCMKVFPFALSLSPLLFCCFLSSWLISKQENSSALGLVRALISSLSLLPSLSCSLLSHSLTHNISLSSHHLRGLGTGFLTKSLTCQQKPPDSVPRIFLVRQTLFSPSYPSHLVVIFPRLVESESPHRYGTHHLNGIDTHDREGITKKERKKTQLPTQPPFDSPYEEATTTLRLHSTQRAPFLQAPTIVHVRDCTDTPLPKSAGIASHITHRASLAPIISPISPEPDLISHFLSLPLSLSSHVGP
ncbi:uncharacterized protein LY79DRAFT_176974 [Colletotrichum navitas]|uniref:Uncharacterized protein n=1 Tax=Colletotrichum navitas TaxID=681940 RepID=A0AAD8V5G6_9PEZI|nr:uncharacterized protein LY79DRAFT_176974 [Colletotrichum navitas]KAK1593674.1 hypothetical protein LY79DRAFT_176974 [Colletotrichum navitas]